MLNYMYKATEEKMLSDACSQLLTKYNMGGQYYFQVDVVVEKLKDYMKNYKQNVSLNQYLIMEILNVPEVRDSARYVILDVLSELRDPDNIDAIKFIISYGAFDYRSTRAANIFNHKTKGYDGDCNSVLHYAISDHEVFDLLMAAGASPLKEEIVDSSFDLSTKMKLVNKEYYNEHYKKYESYCGGKELQRFVNAVHKNDQATISEILGKPNFKEANPGFLHKLMNIKDFDITSIITKENNRYFNYDAVRAYSPKSLKSVTCSLLNIAIFDGNLKLFKALIEAGANPSLNPNPLLTEDNRSSDLLSPLSREPLVYLEHCRSARESFIKYYDEYNQTKQQAVPGEEEPVELSAQKEGGKLSSSEALQQEVDAVVPGAEERRDSENASSGVSQQLKATYVLGSAVSKEDTAKLVHKDRAEAIKKFEEERKVSWASGIAQRSQNSTSPEGNSWVSRAQENQSSSNPSFLEK